MDVCDSHRAVLLLNGLDNSGNANESHRVTCGEAKQRRLRWAFLARGLCASGFDDGEGKSARSDKGKFVVAMDGIGSEDYRRIVRDRTVFLIEPRRNGEVDER